VAASVSQAHHGFEDASIQDLPLKLKRKILNPVPAPIQKSLKILETQSHSGGVDIGVKIYLFGTA
jgi:hypothetical protein